MNGFVRVVRLVLLSPMILVCYAQVLGEYLRSEQTGIDGLYSLVGWVAVAILMLAAVAGLDALPRTLYWLRAAALLGASLLVPWVLASLVGETWWWHGLPLTVGALLPSAAVLLYHPRTERWAWLERVAVILLAITLATPAGYLLHLTLPNEPAVTAPDSRPAYQRWSDYAPTECPGLDGAKAAVIPLGGVDRLELVPTHSYSPGETIPCENITLRGTASDGRSVYYWLSYRHGRESDPWVVRATLDLTAKRGLGAALREAHAIQDWTLESFQAEARSWEIRTTRGTYVLDDANNLCLDRTCKPLP